VRDDVRSILHRAVRWVRDLQHRYSAIGGQVLAGGVALYGFLSLFALLVLAVAILGFLSAGDTNLPNRIVHDLGLTGSAARMVTDGVAAARRSRGITTAVSGIGILWLGTSLAVSIASVYNAAWGVSGRGARDRAIGLLWLGGAGVLFVAAGYATVLWRVLPGVFAPVVIVITLAGNAAALLWTSWVLPNRRASLHALLVPSLMGAVALEVLKVLGGYVVPHYVASSSELYGAIGVVFALLLWLLVFGRLLVYVAVIEVKRARHHAGGAQGWSRSMTQAPDTLR
jgi:membrane protein